MFENADGIFDRDYIDSGWSQFLPDAAMVLHLLAASADSWHLTGDLDTLYIRIGARWCFPKWRDSGLDGPLYWADTARDAARRELFTATLTEAGRTVPTDRRALATLMLDLGVLSRTVTAGIIRWSSVRVLPLLEERLPMPDAWIKAEARRRWQALAAPYSRVLISYFWQELGAPATLTTTVADLAGACHLNPEAIRHGLAHMQDSGRYLLLATAPAADALLDQLLAPGPQSVRDAQVNPEKLHNAQLVTILPDWTYFTTEQHRDQARDAELVLTPDIHPCDRMQFRWR